MKSEAGKTEAPILQPSPDLVALRQIRFFRYLTDADLSRLARIGRRRSYAAGEVIVEKGSDRGGLFVVLSGAAEVEAVTVHPLGPGDFFGEIALLEGTLRTATVRATQPLRAMVFEAMDFRAFLIENPSVAVTLLEGVAERLHEAQDRLDTSDL
jgi:CRP-like cAMP-binding protein